ncbi:hypothetical protein M501DRAFT_988254 [Patellaria atrata CBS 101060]|uniref:Uncharacterized protein n=1 Tax=Patellaria atrata CBS 101060 TaxID=1346257 RepID=A0A9P4SGN8_9PEZI|nr:hypothetical protein M501DRAFT_988254 [Patellaria atrata CBS 101060]
MGSPSPESHTSDVGNTQSLYASPFQIFTGPEKNRKLCVTHKELFSSKSEYIEALCASGRPHGLKFSKLEDLKLAFDKACEGTSENGLNGAEKPISILLHVYDAMSPILHEANEALIDIARKHGASTPNPAAPKKASAGDRQGRRGRGTTSSTNRTTPGTTIPQPRDASSRAGSPTRVTPQYVSSSESSSGAESFPRNAAHAILKAIISKKTPNVMAEFQSYIDAEINLVSSSTDLQVAAGLYILAAELGVEKLVTLSFERLVKHKEKWLPDEKNRNLKVLVRIIYYIQQVEMKLIKQEKEDGKQGRNAGVSTNNKMRAIEPAQKRKSNPTNANTSAGSGREIPPPDSIPALQKLQYIVVDALINSPNGPRVIPSLVKFMERGFLSRVVSGLARKLVDSEREKLQTESNEEVAKERDGQSWIEKWVHGDGHVKENGKRTAESGVIVLETDDTRVEKVSTPKRAKHEHEHKTVTTGTQDVDDALRAHYDGILPEINAYGAVFKDSQGGATSGDGSFGDYESSVIERANSVAQN